MAEVAGLALGVLGLAGLFADCVENFDIVVRAKDFGQDFDLLCTQLSLQQIRLKIWGETLGLVPTSVLRRHVRYNRALDRPDIKPAIVSTLNQLRNMLEKADVITGRYELKEEPGQSSRGMTIFRDSFARFKDNIRRNQKQKSVWKVTRWSIHDYARFKELVDRIRDLLEALESITSALGMLDRQLGLLVEEIQSISDTQSLSLLQEIGSSDAAPAALKTVSDTASVRLSIVTSSSRSYYTARTEQSQSIIGSKRKNSAMFSVQQNWNSLDKASTSRSGGNVKSNIPGESIQYVQYQGQDGLSTVPETAEDIPQHQRWMSALSARSEKTDRLPVFSENDLHYGEALRSIKEHDDHSCQRLSGRLAAQASDNIPLSRRMFIELRNIRRAAVPFISAAPVDDSLDRILASIEGPPGTPYEGGVFWIAVKAVEGKPPMMRFHTRIYHPNIDHTGKLCADYASWWRDAGSINAMNGQNMNLPWFSEHTTSHCSLGALLVALCGLLASPNVEDPLVPEIAETYVSNYSQYYDSAKLYTERYAFDPRPASHELHFPEDDSETAHIYEIPEYRPKAPSQTGTKSVTDSIRTHQKFARFIKSETKREYRTLGGTDDDEESDTDDEEPDPEEMARRLPGQEWELANIHLSDVDFVPGTETDICFGAKCIRSNPRRRPLELQGDFLRYSYGEVVGVMAWRASPDGLLFLAIKWNHKSLNSVGWVRVSDFIPLNMYMVQKEYPWRQPRAQHMLKPQYKMGSPFRHRRDQPVDNANESDRQHQVSEQKHSRSVFVFFP